MHACQMRSLSSKASSAIPPIPQTPSTATATANANPGRPGGLAAGGLDINLILNNNFDMSVSFLLSQAHAIHADRLHARMYKEDKAAKLAAARAAAAEMEVNAPNDQLVAELVAREIGKTTAALRKEVASLRVALKGGARSNQGAGSGNKSKSESPTTKKSGDGGKARARPPANDSKPPRKPPAKQASKNANAKQPNKNANQETKKKNQAKQQ
ncbi:hypothetical protein AC1031_010053 [Aphanomyces cochlioides]|nr:hypothetical protein AC1031_010053 [Aphanomyces cochlioides]